MITLTVVLPEDPSDTEIEDLISECSDRWKKSSTNLKIENDIREALCLSSGPASREYRPDELAEMGAQMKLTPQTAIWIYSGREPGTDDLALWFAAAIVARWGGFIDGNGEVIFEGNWTRKEDAGEME